MENHPGRQVLDHKPSGRGLICLVCLLSTSIWISLMSTTNGLASDASSTPLDARRAYEYLLRICRLGPRVSGSLGMAEQQRLISQYFSEHGARVHFQAFDASHPQTGDAVRMNNIIVSWHPETPERVLFACHYDTRPFPDRDRVNPRGEFLGANDGASGVALFMELAHHMADVKPAHGYGVDFVFFDGEEFVYSDRDKYFLGSEHFATQYRDHPPAFRYVYGILVDMIGDRRLELYLEKNSVRYAKNLTLSLWRTAQKLNVREFVGRVRHDVRDDHFPLNQIAHIPTCDIIDFDYPYWHTTKDKPVACSGSSLTKVGTVLLKWLTEIPAPAASSFD